VTDGAELARLYREALTRESGREGESWLSETWGGPGRFAARSFGFGLLADDELVAICAACAIAQNTDPAEAEIEIWTAAAHRKKGLALATASAFMHECHTRGMEAAWTCDSANQPSHRLALRLGFSFLRRVTGFPLAAAHA
jgi:RimJ/RimL family protein N-acetyltransferase